MDYVALKMDPWDVFSQFLAITLTFYIFLDRKIIKIYLFFANKTEEKTTGIPSITRKL